MVMHLFEETMFFISVQQRGHLPMEHNFGSVGCWSDSELFNCYPDIEVIHFRVVLYPGRRTW
ncbi:Chlorophyll a-b binding protein of LHCII type I chloroplastic [Bienertia sinuspersici]